MKTFQVTVSGEALEQLAQGGLLGFEPPEFDLRVILRADTAAVDALRRHVHNALLDLLPVRATEH